MQLNIHDLIASLQYGGIFVLLFLFPPEFIMPLVGYLAWTGVISLWIGVVAAVIGSTLSSAILYLLVRRYGDKTTESKIVRYLYSFKFSQTSLQRADAWFASHARFAVLASRFVPGFRTIISIPAGMQKMPAGLFLLYATAGNLVWISVLTMLGYWADAGYTNIQSSVANATTFIAIMTAIGFIIRFHHHREKQHSDQ